MVIKNMFGRRKRPADPEDREMTIEDLITLERYDEAEEKLRARLKLVPKDLHAHLRLAEVQLELGNLAKALDEYVFVADSQADDGFYDKAVAILSKAAKLAPGDEMLPKRLDKYRQMKQLGLGRMFLHASSLSFEDPVNGEFRSFSAPLPDELRAVLDSLEKTPKRPRRAR